MDTGSIAHHFMMAVDLAEIELEKKARAILAQHPNLDEFVVGMGGWHFIRKNGTLMNGYDCPKYCNGLRDFVDKWDGALKLTGDPMRFTATGKKRTDW